MRPRMLPAMAVVVPLAFCLLLGCRSSRAGDRETSPKGNETARPAAEHPTDTWDAWLEQSDDGSPRLIVSGRVQVPTPCHEANLSAAQTPAGRLSALPLELIVSAPAGICAQVVSSVEARYERQEGMEDVKTVRIHYPGGSVWEVPVKPRQPAL
ncbi:MAG: hypothetical protein BWZ08_02214 [candidate division BRC1 bacterium ADurb.BinA292]|nr:MAG: hypothetical protein BWZ08_02214 [candidate division BRC1 bacterium ADurb.BinA292]